MENEFKLFNQSIFLRDTSIEDIDDYVIWNTEEIEWQDWDAPWEKGGIDSEIYTQTWSGNNRMIRLAEKCGFEIVHREINYREVREKMYDNLTFKLNNDLFWNRFKHLE